MELHLGGSATEGATRLVYRQKDNGSGILNMLNMLGIQKHYHGFHMSKYKN